MLIHPLRRRRLGVILLALTILGFSSALIMYALRQNINLFYTPSDILTQNIARDKLIRLGGLVVPGSIIRHGKNLKVSFEITDNKNVIKVLYDGILPDLFREGQSIVTQGYLINLNEFKAIEVLAKHDENYMPQELKAVLNQNSKIKATQ